MKATISFLFAAMLVIASSSCKKETIQPTPISYSGNIKQAQSALPPTAANNLHQTNTALHIELPDKIAGVYYGNVYGHCDGDVCGDMANYGEGTATVTKVSKNVISVTAAYTTNQLMVYQGISAFNNSYWFSATQPYHADVFFKIDSNNISFGTSASCQYAFYGVK